MSFYHVAVGMGVALAVLLMVPAGASAETLESVEAQVTSSDAYDSTPTLGADATGEMVVFTSRPALPEGGYGWGEILCQRLNEDGTTSGLVVTVSDGTTDDKLNDVSGSLVVYTAFESKDSQLGRVMVYDLAAGTHTAIIDQADTVFEARIAGNAVVWTQGQAGALKVMYYDLGWASGLPVVIGGPTPPASNVDIGDRYVVWEEDVDYQGDIVAYDLFTGLLIAVSSVADLDERQPATAADIVVWESTAMDGTMTIELADLSQTPPVRTTVASGSAAAYAPSIDGDLVAYESDPDGDLDIFLYRISDAETFQVTTDPAHQWLNNLHGDKVAYVDSRSGSLDVYVSTFAFVSDDPCADLGGDTDGDGLCDDDDPCPLTAENDADGDGICGDDDNCPTVSNSAQLDGDTDGLGDACDACPNDATNDGDGDGVCTDVDNCPRLANTDQSDQDGDGAGDLCDVCPKDADDDADKDGLCADEDPCPGDATNTCGVYCVNPIVIDFEFDASGAAILAGAVIDDQYALAGVTISAANANVSHPDAAICFDSANPTGGDTDLRTPGSGAGNDTALGNILIIAERLTDADGDGLVDNPDDEAQGGSLTFSFAVPVVLSSLTVIDIEETGAMLLTTSDGGTAELSIPASTDNSVQTLALDGVLATSLDVVLPGSGAVDRLAFCLTEDLPPPGDDDDDDDDDGGDDDGHDDCGGCDGHPNGHGNGHGYGHCQHGNGHGYGHNHRHRHNQGHGGH